MSYKKYLFFPVLSAILLLLPNLVFSGGYESPGLGARGSSMGGAFVGVADEWTAVYWNPAGLAQLKGTKVGVDLYLLNIKNEDPDSVANPAMANINEKRGDVFAEIYPSEPDKFNKTETETTSLLPSVGGYKELKNLTLGFGFYVPVGTKTKWDDKIKDALYNADILGEYSDFIGLSVATICAAKKINEKLSLGGGLNYVMLKSEKEVKKSYKSSSISALDYEYNTTANSSGNGVEGIGGVLYKASNKLNLGLVYRSGSKLDLDGDAKITHTVPSAITEPTLKAIITAINGQSDLEAKFYHPATYGIGLAYEHCPKLTLAFDWARTDWSTMKKKITYKVESLLLKNKDKSLDWKATERYRLGVRYKKDENLTLSCGLYTDGAPSPVEAQGITGVVDPELKALFVGASYKKVNLNSDIGLGYAFGKRKDGDNEFKNTALGLMFTLSRNF